MPISTTSRYFGLPVYKAVAADDTAHPTLAMRPAAPPPPGTGMVRHVLTGDETLEYLAFRHFGSSDAWWRIAEANPTRFPTDWKPGMVVNIPSAGDVGRVVRTRTF